MINPIEELEKNAGKIWKTLKNDGSSLSQTNLQRTANLDDQEFFSAIGWLARENKIYKTGITYRLGETNLTQIIGTNAGKIWTLLESQKITNVAHHTTNSHR